MSALHTPGPWDVGHHADDRIAIWATDVTVAFAYDVDDGRLDANARLIAAAPELLEVAKAVLKVNRVAAAHGLAPLMRQASAAIAKATGAA